jgi:L-fucose mutarotase/ribose pyranase (RbsD/FucU family)
MLFITTHHGGAPVLHRDRFRPPKPIKPWKGPKPKLKMSVIPHYRVHFRVLEAYLATVFQMQDYDIKLATGAKCGMTPEFVVTGSLPPANTMGQQVLDIRRGRKTRRLGLILDLLCLDGFISAGVYIIDMTEGDEPFEAYRKILNERHDPLSPECLKIKSDNRRDSKFVKQVAVLDRKINELKQAQENQNDAT